MSINILLNFRQNILSIDLRETANVFDLKQAIFDKTKIPLVEQNFEEFSLKEVADDIPLIALGIDFTNVLTLKNETKAKAAVVTVNRPTLPSAGISRFLRPQLLISVLDFMTCDRDTFVAVFESKYGVVHPSFLGDKFSLVLKTCKLEKKLLVAYLFAPSVDSFDFCSLTLSSEILSEYLGDSQIPFWVGEVSKNKEQIFRETFGVPITFPFLAVFGFVDGVAKIYDVINQQMLAAEFIKRLDVANQAHKGHVNQILEKEKRNKMEREIQEEQNRAFQRSLEEDNEKELLRLAEQESLVTSKTCKMSQLTDVRKRCLDRFAALPKEPDVNDKSVKSVRICVKLLDGTRIERRFSNQDTLGMIFTFVEGSIAHTFTDTNFLDPSSPPFDSNTGDIIPWTIEKYELVQNYPKKTFSFYDGSTTLEALNLGGQSIFYLQRSN